jgi:hypothetical protein
MASLIDLSRRREPNVVIVDDVMDRARRFAPHRRDHEK